MALAAYAAGAGQRSSTDAAAPNGAVAAICTGARRMARSVEARGPASPAVQESGSACRAARTTTCPGRRAARPRITTPIRTSGGSAVATVGVGSSPSIAVGAAMPRRGAGPTTAAYACHGT